MGDRYILNANGDPEPANLIEWAQWYEKADRQLKRTDFRGGSVFVSTVFLALDHSFGGATPLLWETMVFGFPDGHELDHECERYAARTSAEVGHEAMVVRVQMALAKEN